MSPRLVTLVLVLLFLGITTMLTSARSLPDCRTGSSCSYTATFNPTAISRRWLGFGATDAPWYPSGYCATECSWNPAQLMRHCAGDAAAGIPTTSCQPVDDDSVCPIMRYLDAVLPENYCMPRFTEDCSHPDNIGCSSRCILYIIINYHCVADAVDPATGEFNQSCVYCNMCWDRSHSAGTVAAQKVPYALVQARSETGGLTKNHWLVLPKAPCTGIESMAPGCTDAIGEYLWANAYHEAIRLGFTDLAQSQQQQQQQQQQRITADWALIVNAPNRRGVHQLHIHIAGFDTERSAPGVSRSQWLIRRIADHHDHEHHQDLSTSVDRPTVVTGEGYYNAWFFNHSSCSRLGRPPRNWARAYVVFVATNHPVRDLGRSIRPWDLARHISVAAGSPGSQSYGILVMPGHLSNGRTGLIIGILWSTDDVEQLDVSELPGDPVRFSRTCHNYIGLDSLVAARNEHTAL